jgi:hypothetical protein
MEVDSPAGQDGGKAHGAEQKKGGRPADKVEAPGPPPPHEMICPLPS